MLEELMLLPLVQDLERVSLMYWWFSIVRLNTFSYKGIETRSLEIRIFPVKLRPLPFH